MQRNSSIRNCSVAVVGGAGFLGSHLVDHLVNDRGCEVLVIDNLVAGNKDFVNKNAELVHHDITGSESYLRRLFACYKVQWVFNYAAYPYIPVSFIRPLHVFNVNAFGALKVINAAHEAGVQGILQVSSAELYGGCLSGALDENAPVVPHSTYGAAKAAIDALVAVRHKEAETPVLSLRQFNCVGARETHPYIVPEIIGQIANQSHTGPITIKLGNNSSRDFMDARDAVEAAAELLETGTWGEAYNLGAESCIKVYDLATMIARSMGVSGTVEVVNDPLRNRPWEIWHLCSDNTKIYQKISYRPRYSLQDAINQAVTYYKENGYRWNWEE